MSVQFEQAKQSAKKIGKRMLMVISIAAVLLASGYVFWRTYTVSEGTRSGLLFKISKKGYVFKTYEGQLHLGGSIMLTPQSTWDFSAKDEAVYQELQKYEGKNVTLHYREKVNTFAWQGDTDYIVYEVDAAE